MEAFTRVSSWEINQSSLSLAQRGENVVLRQEGSYGAESDVRIDMTHGESGRLLAALADMHGYKLVDK